MRAWFGLVLLIGAAPAAAQTVTLRDVVTATLATHPTASLADAGVQRADAALAESRAALFPGVALEGSATRFELPMVVAPLHGFDPQSPPVFDRTLVQSSLNVTWQAFDGGGRSARAGRANAQLEVAVAAEESARQMLIADATRAFAALMAARELMRAQDARVTALEQERGRAARLHDEGRAARVVVLRADAALSAARAERATAAADVDAAERQLARTMGASHDSVRVLTLENAHVRGAAPDRDGIVQEMMERNPEIRRLEAAVSAARHSARDARAQWWPRIGVGGRYVRYASGEGDAGGEWQTGVQLQYPLFTGGARAAVNDRAGAELRAAEAELAIARLRQRAAVDNAWSAWVAAAARADAWRAAVEQNAEVVRIERLALDAGAGVQTDYLNAEADLLRARAALVQAQAAELNARIELARLSGALSLEWIAENVEPGS